MNIKTIKKPGKRIDVRYLSTLGIKTYGHDNLYPQWLQDVVSASGTGKTCLNRYARFIEGSGFLNVAFAEYTVNRSKETADDIARSIAKDLAQFNGFALHVNYNIFGEIIEVQHVPFENCRLEEEDDDGTVANIIVHPDWRGQKTRSGKAVKVSLETIEMFPVFNPTREVVQAQIQRAGGIEFYKGQILWVSGDGKNTYPTARYDAVISEMSTDEGLSNVKHRNVRNNFLPAGMVVTYKGQTIDDEGNVVKTEGIEDELASFQGDENACNFLNVEIETPEEKPEFTPFPVRNFDKDFSVTDGSVVERIYSAFDQEIFHCIRVGKLGFSGEVIKEAYEYYSSLVNSERRMIERAFDAIFKHWYEVANDTADYSIQPLKYITTDGINNTTGH